MWWVRLQHLGEHDQLEDHDAEDVQLHGFGQGQQDPGQEVGDVVHPAVHVHPDHYGPGDEAAVKKWMAHCEIPVKLRKQKRQYIHP